MRILLLLLVLAVQVHAVGRIRSAALVGDARGIRLEFELDSLLLSRSLPVAPGEFAIEFLDARTDLSALDAAIDAPGSPFRRVRIESTVMGNRPTVSFRFRVPEGARSPVVLHRHWDGRRLRFVISEAPAARPMGVKWSRLGLSSPMPAPDLPMPLAAPSLRVNLRDVQLRAVDSIETLDLHFDGPLESADLRRSADGKGFDLLLRGVQIAPRHLRIPADGGFTVRALARSREKNVTVLRLDTRGEHSGAILLRSPSRLTVRLMRTTPADGVISWKSGDRDVESIVFSAVPSDELGSAPVLGRTTTGATFHPVDPSSPGPTTNGATTAPLPVSAANNIQMTEAERLQAERRKAEEFARQELEAEEAERVRREAADRIVYNTFGVRDPFIPLDPSDARGGLNIDQMRVVGIIQSSTRPMAVLEHTTQPGLSVALREGDEIQNGRVFQILRDEVVFILEEFGVSRRFTLRLQIPRGEQS